MSRNAVTADDLNDAATLLVRYANGDTTWMKGDDVRALAARVRQLSQAYADGRMLDVDSLTDEQATRMWDESAARFAVADDGRGPETVRAALRRCATGEPEP